MEHWILISQRQQLPTLTAASSKTFTIEEETKNFPHKTKKIMTKLVPQCTPEGILSNEEKNKHIQESMKKNKPR